MLDPRLRCWVDRGQRIVVHRKKAVALSIIEFAIFDALFRAGGILKTRELRSSIYNGVKEPPLTASHVVAVSIYNLNQKLRRLNLRVEGTNRRENSFYRIRNCE